MKKELIIVVVLVIAIILVDFFTHNYTKTSFEKMNNELEKIKEISKNIENNSKQNENSIAKINIEESNQEAEKQQNDETIKQKQELQEKIKIMEDDWKNINKKTAYYIEHDELEKVNASIVKFKSYILLEEYTEAIPELENCKYILNHIREKEEMKIINLF